MEEKEDEVNQRNKGKSQLLEFSSWEVTDVSRLGLEALDALDVSCVLGL